MKNYQNVDYEVRAGFSSVYNVVGEGWVANDVHSKSASRMLDYSYDDYAAYKLGVALGKPDNVTSFLLGCAVCAPFTLFNERTGLRSWAGEDQELTE